MWPLEKGREFLSARRELLPRARICANSRFTTGLMSRVMTTCRLRHTGKPYDGMTATPSPASTMAIWVSRLFITVPGRALMPARLRCLAIMRLQRTRSRE